MLLKDLHKLDGLYFIHLFSGVVFKYNHHKFCLGRTKISGDGQSFFVRIDQRDILWVPPFSSIRLNHFKSIKMGWISDDEVSLNTKYIQLFDIQKFLHARILFKKFNQIYSSLGDDRDKRVLIHSKGLYELGIIKLKHPDRYPQVIWFNIFNNIHNEWFNSNTTLSHVNANERESLIMSDDDWSIFTQENYQKLVSYFVKFDTNVQLYFQSF